MKYEEIKILSKQIHRVSHICSKLGVGYRVFLPFAQSKVVTTIPINVRMEPYNH